MALFCNCSELRNHLIPKSCGLCGPVTLHFSSIFRSRLQSSEFGGCSVYLYTQFSGNGLKTVSIEENLSYNLRAVFFVTFTKFTLVRFAVP